MKLWKLPPKKFRMYILNLTVFQMAVFFLYYLSERSIFYLMRTLPIFHQIEFPVPFFMPALVVFFAAVTLYPYFSFIKFRKYFAAEPVRSFSENYAVYYPVLAGGLVHFFMNLYVYGNIHWNFTSCYFDIPAVELWNVPGKFDIQNFLLLSALVLLMVYAKKRSLNKKNILIALISAAFLRIALTILPHFAVCVILNTLVFSVVFITNKLFASIMRWMYLIACFGMICIMFLIRLPGFHCTCP